VPLEYHDAHPTGERVGEFRHERALASNLCEVFEVPDAISLLKDALAAKDGELTALKTALDKRDRELEELRAQLRDLRRDPPPGLLTPEEEDIVTQVREKLKAIHDSGANSGTDKTQAEVQELHVRHNSCGSHNVSELRDELPSRTPTTVRYSQYPFRESAPLVPAIMF
jgi:chromosome segregation ATPase